MNEPFWLEKEELLAVQAELLARFGGPEGIRDESLLESALHPPRQLSHYGDPSLFELGASYAAGVIQNHPFLDGNKRAGFVACYVFLGMNGLRLEAPEEEAVIQTLGLAAGDLDEAGYADWLSRSCGEC